MEFDALSYYTKNIEKLKIRESTSYGVHIDDECGMVLSCTDFGHIHIYHRNDTCDVNDNSHSKKTLRTLSAPILCSALLSIDDNAITSPRSKILVCGGRNNMIRGYYLDSLINAASNSTIPADIELSSGNCDVASIITFADSIVNDLIYAANDQGRIFCYNIASGRLVMDTARGHFQHPSSIHTLRITRNPCLLLSCDYSGQMGIWDIDNPGKILATPNAVNGISNNLHVNIRNIWVSSMDVDTDGNFVYLGGGIETTDEKANNAFHRPSTGWLASILLCSDFSTSDCEATTLIKCRSLPVPVQVLHLRDAELVSGGAQPLITFWNCLSLEPVSSMTTSSQSIFALTSTLRKTANDDDTNRIFAIGGTMPVVDLVSVIGHKESVLWPM